MPGSHEIGGSNPPSPTNNPQAGRYSGGTIHPVWVPACGLLGTYLGIFGEKKKQLLFEIALLHEWK